MEISARAYVFDEHDRVLLVKNSADQQWTLPGGHSEEGENVYQALVRELHEEFDIEITLVGSENEFSERNIKAMPLPVSIHKIRYEHRSRGMVDKLEFIFFARLKGEFSEIISDEIYEWSWFETEEVIDMDESEIFVFISEILEQNIDLLELVG